MLYTEGVEYVVENVGAYWLLDEIALAQRHIIPVKREDFQVWDLVVNSDQKALLTCGDGNGREVYSKPVPFTDFPEQGIRFYYPDQVIHLSSEYWRKNFERPPLSTTAPRREQGVAVTR